jgi:CubicO group peptidase (beta-lactamase class C family)
MLVLFLLTLLPFQGQALLSFTQVATWFDTFIAPYESIGKFDAFVFSYFTENSSSIQTAVRGRCYSLAGTDIGVPDPAVSLFRIGSVTKLLTATAILQLYEKGLLDLNASVITYVPSLSAIITSDMKVIHTLSHTVGVDERMLNIYISSSSGIKESLAKASRVLWTQQLVSPGSRITYSNLGLTIMGAVVEGISQQALSEYFQQNIVKPLNLSVLKFHHDMNGNFTNVCYPRSALHYEPYQIRTTSSGDIYTTLNDVSKFLSSHLNNGSGLFQKPETAQLMHSRLYPTAFDGMAYMFQRQNFRNRTVLSKDGGVFHFTCNAALYPEYREGVFAASTVGPHPTAGFLEEDIMFEFVADNYNTSIQPEFPFSVDSGVQLSPIQGVYTGSRSGQKSPLKLYYLLRNSYLQVSGDSIITAGVTYRAALNVPGLSSRQLLLMANTSTSPNKKNQFMLVTFTDSSKTTVSQIEQYPDFNTLQPLVDWRNNMLTVFVLFGFAMLAQLMSAFGFPIICAYVLCKRQPLTIFYLMGLSLAFVSWMSIGFFISLATTPFPRIFFGVQPGFIAIQALAIIMSVFILLWTLSMLACWIKNDSCNNPWSVTVNYDRVQSGKYFFNQFFFSLKSLSKFFLVFWVMIIIFQIIGIPGYFALNLLSFNIW